MPTTTTLALAIVLVALPALATEPLTIVAFGSSTTAPRGSVDIYARVLERELPAKGVPVKVVNSGVPGDTTVRARKRFERDVLAHKPDVVVIFLGGNDSAVDVWKGATNPRVPRPLYEKNLTYFIRTLRDRGAQTILMTPNLWRWTPKLKELYGKPPYDVNAPYGFCVSLRGHCDSVRKVAKDERVPLVDVFKAFEEYEPTTGKSIDKLFLDGMHPNSQGHRIIADLLIPKILDIAKK